VKVGIEALDFINFGGGQIDSAEFIKILQELNHTVIVFCDKKYNNDDIQNLKDKWGIDEFKPVYVPNLKNVSLNSFLFNLIQLKYKLDCYFSVGWLILTKSQAKKIPTYRYALAPHSPFLYRKFRQSVKKFRGNYYLLKILETFFNNLLDTSGKYSRTRITQSKYIQCLYKKYYNIDYEVIYPPVYQKDLFSQKDKKESTIVSLGRITCEKNYHVVLKLAKKYSNFNFKIIGGFTPSRENYSLLKDLKTASKKMKNLEVLVNLKRNEVIKILSESRFFLHLMRTEHFGIAIVEALKCGMTPIVPKNSGPDEIINYGEFGHNFVSFKDLISNFKNLLKPLDPSNQVERAKKFTTESFRKKAFLSIQSFFKKIV